MTPSTEILRRAHCCACRKPGPHAPDHINLVALRRRPTWEYPSAGNALTGDGPCAVAIVCDDCVAAQRVILEAVELRDRRVVYHDVYYLEELPPEPTHVLVRRHGREGIECLVCGMTSWHPEDVVNRYCGNCHRFTRSRGGEVLGEYATPGGANRVCLAAGGRRR